jgi:hypothetical protein
MEWVRHHDRYETGELADLDRPYWPVEASPSEGCACERRGAGS